MSRKASLSAIMAAAAAGAVSEAVFVARAAAFLSSAKRLRCDGQEGRRGLDWGFRCGFSGTLASLLFRFGCGLLSC